PLPPRPPVLVLAADAIPLPGVKVSTPLPAESVSKAPVVSVVDEDLGPETDSHRGRTRERELLRGNLESMINSSRSSAQYWRLIRGWTDAKRRGAQVTAAQLREVFEGRLNPPEVLPDHFNVEVHEWNTFMVDNIPESTPDRTPGKIFSRPFTIEDVEKIKVRIRKHEAKSA
ncbi:hypothetical protein C8R46DRAFT_838164, partial [Mycena filopes]